MKIRRQIVDKWASSLNRVWDAIGTCYISQWFSCSENVAGLPNAGKKTNIPNITKWTVIW